MTYTEIKTEITKVVVAPNVTGAEMKEIQRLRFVLDKANRFPNLLSSNETLKLARKLADLERRAHNDKGLK